MPLVFRVHKVFQAFQAQQALLELPADLELLEHKEHLVPLVCKDRLDLVERLARQVLKAQLAALDFPETPVFRARSALLELLVHPETLAIQVLQDCLDNPDQQVPSECLEHQELQVDLEHQALPDRTVLLEVLDYLAYLDQLAYLEMQVLPVTLDSLATQEHQD